MTLAAMSRNGAMRSELRAEREKTWRKRPSSMTVNGADWAIISLIVSSLI